MPLTDSQWEALFPRRDHQKTIRAMPDHTTLDPILSELGPHNDVTLPKLIEFLSAKIAEIQKAIAARDQMHNVWSKGTSEHWRKAGCTLSKKDRLQVANTQARIALKLRKELRIYQVILLRLEALATSTGKRPK